MTTRLTTTRIVPSDRPQPHITRTAETAQSGTDALGTVLRIMRGRGVVLG